MGKEIEVVPTKSQSKRFFARFLKEEKGATAVEYGLMVGLIAVVILAAVTTLGSTISLKFEEAQCKIAGKTWVSTGTTAATRCP